MGNPASCDRSPGKPPRRRTERRPARRTRGRTGRLERQALCFDVPDDEFAVKDQAVRQLRLGGCHQVPMVAVMASRHPKHPHNPGPGRSAPCCPATPRPNYRYCACIPVTGAGHLRAAGRPVLRRSARPPVAL